MRSSIWVGENMSQITKRQHTVPAFYLRQWCKKGDTNIVTHDLDNLTAFSVAPENILVRGLYYEEDPTKPDNRIENILAVMEGECSKVFKKLNSIDFETINSKSISAQSNSVREVLNEDACQAIKKIAVFQYLRVPGAIEQKAYELTPSELSQERKDYLLNAGRFLDTGFSYMENHFKSLKIMVLISKGQDFITSDWPCFDLKDSDFSPLLGEEIGRESDVIVYFPLTPRLNVVLYPINFVENGNRAPEVSVLECNDSIVRNNNTLVIQQADRFVIANDKKDFIFSVSKKRKKSKKINANN